MNNQNMINIIEENFFKFSLLLGRCKKGVVYDGDDIKWSYSGLNVLDRVIYLNITEENVDKYIEEIINKFTAWNAPLAWFIGTSTKPKNLSQYLEKYNFVNTGDWVGMSKDISSLVNQPDNNEIEIKEVIGESMFNEWGEIICAGFEIHDYFKEDTLKVFSDLIDKGDKSLKHYIAYKNSEPVSACTLFSGIENIAGIYFVATKPEYRGRGIATGLVNYVLNIAKNENYKISVLQATDMGTSVYKKMGYEEYCRFNVYVWSPYQ